MKRKKDWAMRFARYVNSYAHKEFKYGDYDCATFVLGAVRAMTGRDLLEEQSIHHKSLQDGVATIKRYGSSYEEATSNFAKSTGLVEVPPLMAGKGDIVLLKVEDESCVLGLVDLDGWRCLVPSFNGMTHRNLDMAIRAWRI